MLGGGGGPERFVEHQALAVRFALRRLAPQLQLAALKLLDVDGLQHFQRPEPAVAGLRLQVGVGVGGADVDRVARLLLDEVTVSWPGDIDLAGSERLHGFDLSFPHAGEVSRFMNPNFRQVFLNLAAALSEDGLV